MKKNCAFLSVPANYSNRHLSVIGPFLKGATYTGAADREKI